MSFTTKEISSAQYNIDKIVEEQLRVKNALEKTQNLSQTKASQIVEIVERYKQNN